MVALIVMVAAITLFFSVLFIYGLRGEPNRGPALGNNSPYPTDISGEEPPYLPGPVISEDEEFRRDAHARLSYNRPRGHKR
jgi:hypothetical protein